MNRDLEHLQSRILDCRTSDGQPVSGRELARVMSCDPSEVTRFRQGERAMDCAEIAALVRRFGVGTLAPLADLDGGRVVSERSEPMALAGGTVKLVTAAGALLESAHLAVADGRLDGDERTDLRRQIEAIRDVLGRVEAGLR